MSQTPEWAAPTDLPDAPRQLRVSFLAAEVFLHQCIGAGWNEAWKLLF